MKQLILIVLAAMSVVGSVLVHAGDDHHPASSEFKTSTLADQLFLLRGKGGNIVLLRGDQGLVMIDADYKDMSPALKSVLAEYGGVEQVMYLINTHWHGDHTEGNDMLGHHAQIVAHDNVRTRLLTRQEVKLFGMVSEPYSDHAVPSMTYDKRMSLYVNGEHIDVVHFPHGHTDGDSVVFFKNANIVHMGDHFFSGMFPFVDVQNGGNVIQMTENVAAVLAIIDDKTIVVPGHGLVSDKAGLQAFHDMLVGTTAEVNALIDEGLSVEDIKAEGLSLDWEDWSNGLISSDQWLGIILQSLNK